MSFILALIARFAPFNALRIAALRAMRGVQVGRRVRLGLGCRIKVDQMVIGGDVKIGRFNRFVGPVSISIGERTQNGAHNTFGCGDWVSAPRYVEEGYARAVRLGAECLITHDHYLNCACLIEVGDGTWFAGRASQLSTHGVELAERDVVIGGQRYLSLAVRLAPDARLGDECILSLGSVLTGDLSVARYAMIAGIPAKLVKQIEADYASGRIERHGANW